MINLDQAIEIVEAELKRMSQSLEADEIVFDRDGIMTREYGWLFYYDSRKYKETGDFRFALLGNHPMYVDKETGCIDYVYISIDLGEDVIDIYESEKYG